MAPASNRRPPTRSRHTRTFRHENRLGIARAGFPLKFSEL